MTDKKDFLMDMKLMFNHGKHHASQKTRFDRRLAIHHIHYVVEQILRERASDTHPGSSTENLGFKKLINKINAKGKIRDRKRLEKLNDARNDAQHHNIVLGQEDTEFFVKIVEDFLRGSYNKYFGEDFDKLNLVSFISDYNIRYRLEQAQKFLDQNKQDKALERMYMALGNFRTKIFNFFRLRELNQIIGFGNVKLGDAIAHNDLKLLFFRDRLAIEKLNRMQYIKIEEREGETYFEWQYNFSGIYDAKKEFDEILNIILTHQDQFQF
ncbi:MAG: hypothetical protein A7316_00425 [Candidatus Altiarchaeales archaeon WOR_SM1_86-2]|nr:MAG: hypothetical protein A7315_14220 [Candidatus Altiarchaeales archaeon WOR_SM1_79]ODS38198.1 MAG: hypothetical protein A7316_00425 [Candidatus Altiarchaeales archaeon WOR_SM1_86-2]